MRVMLNGMYIQPCIERTLYVRNELRILMLEDYFKNKAHSNEHHNEGNEQCSRNTKKMYNKYDVSKW
jgi:hypothetical protein